MCLFQVPKMMEKMEKQFPDEMKESSINRMRDPQGQ